MRYSNFSKLISRFCIFLNCIIFSATSSRRSIAKHVVCPPIRCWSRFFSSFWRAASRFWNSFSTFSLKVFVSSAKLAIYDNWRLSLALSSSLSSSSASQSYASLASPLPFSCSWYFFSCILAFDSSVMSMLSSSISKKSKCFWAFRFAFSYFLACSTSWSTLMSSSKDYSTKLASSLILWNIPVFIWRSTFSAKLNFMMSSEESEDDLKLRDSGSVGSTLTGRASMLMPSMSAAGYRSLM